MAQPSIWLKLLRYLKPHGSALAFGTIALLATNLLGVYIPWRIKETVDSLNGAIEPQTLLVNCLILLALSTVMMVIRIASRQAIFGVGREVEVALKQQIFAHLLTMAPSYFNTNQAGDLISRSTNDVDNVRRLLGFSILSIVNTLFAYVLTLPLMFILDWQLALGAMAVYPLMLGVVLVFSNRLRDEQQAVQEKLGDVSNLIQEDLNGIALIKVYAQEENERRAFDERNFALRDNNIRLALSRNLLFPLFGGLAAGSLIVLLALGGPRLAAGTLSIGAFTALTVYVERLVFPTALLGFTLTSFQRGQVSLERIEAILATPTTIADAPNAQSLTMAKGEVRAQNVTFTYPGRAEPALADLSFNLKPGEVVAVVGPIGSGKTTLANALCRLLEVSPNQLFLDDQDITQLKLTDLRYQVAYVPQESFLFGATVAENIGYGRPDLPLAEVIRVAKLARVHDEIMTFPQTYETLVGERGITLSGGQRQRVALARALLMDGAVLILDDALASVDNETAENILNNLTAQGNKTVLFVTHRLSAAARADRVLVLDQGRLVEEGTHEQLSRQGGVYGALWTRYQLESVLT
ncbi:ABC transporter ATP-binding protein [Candidatus Cyanaurora vandensis]|uniref:ABC transporter ATP-binding protein n=1 Tax=Candidatus Cyanaurora vandensis TaxID=2714958 RepID=UPI002579D2CC|nr:ABC transporter ATP-binding protein [Candidatus Cyanaurora vandensis]